MRKLITGPAYNDYDRLLESEYIMKIGCVCGNILNNENLETTTPLIIFPSNDYYDVLELNPKTVEELVVKMPIGSMW